MTPDDIWDLANLSQKDVIPGRQADRAKGVGIGAAWRVRDASAQASAAAEGGHRGPDADTSRAQDASARASAAAEGGHRAPGAAEGVDEDTVMEDLVAVS
jgi:hypothetical protein